jgi:hypothetical protein
VTPGLLSIAAGLIAYQAGTHARLTADGAAEAQLHDALVAWGLRGGGYQSLRLDLEQLDRRAAFAWRERLARVDPAWGGAADAAAEQRAWGWLIAGSVLEEAPASRGRHHFLDPRDGSGLVESRPGVEWLLGALAAADGEGSFAGALAGSNFGMVGEPADRWVVSPSNEWGVAAFHRELRAAMLDADPSRRAAAMARALLALGSIAHVLQDMASPTHVRNDLWVGHLGERDASTFDRSSRYERFVEVARPRIGARRDVVPRAALGDRFRALAAWTQRAFYSPGTRPASVRLTPGIAVDRVEAEANAGAPYPEPRLRGLDLGRPSGYAGADGVAHLVAWRIDRAGVLRFDLDERCFLDAARVLLPAAVAHTAALIGHLVRTVDVRVASDGRAEIDTGRLPAQGELVVFWEDRQGVRRELRRVAAGGLSAGIEIPGEAERIGALLDGRDDRGEPLVAAGVIEL